MKLSFRPACEADLDTIAAIERQVFSDPWSRATLRDSLYSPNVQFIAAEAIVATMTELVGYSIVRAVAGSAEILNLAVAPSHRRRKVGARVLDYVLECARTDGIGELFLEVRESNAAARALYRAAGFSQIGQRPKYYRRPDEEALILRKVLE